MYRKHKQMLCLDLGPIPEMRSLCAWKYSQIWEIPKLKTVLVPCIWIWDALCRIHQNEHQRFLCLFFFPLKVLGIESRVLCVLEKPCPGAAFLALCG